MENTLLKQKKYAKSFHLYVALTLILVVAGGYYFFQQYQRLTFTKQALAQEQETLSSLQTNVSTASNQYVNFKKDFDQRFSPVLGALDEVFPTGEKQTDLARLFDQFEKNNTTSANPIEISDIRFGISRSEKDKEYATLPLSVTFTGSKDNFSKFLRFIENSGLLEDKTRLMDVRSIGINFISTIPQADPGQSSQPLLNVTVALNAYFQKSTDKNKN